MKAVNFSEWILMKKICDLNIGWIVLLLLGYEGKINFNISVGNLKV